MSTHFLLFIKAVTVMVEVTCKTCKSRGNGWNMVTSRSSWNTLTGLHLKTVRCVSVWVTYPVSLWANCYNRIILATGTASSVQSYKLISFTLLSHVLSLSSWDLHTLIHVHTQKFLPNVYTCMCMFMHFQMNKSAFTHMLIHACIPAVTGCKHCGYIRLQTCTFVIYSALNT